MPRPVYSTRFLIGQASSPAQSITVPSGFRAVIRCVTVVTFHEEVAYWYFSVAGITIVGLNDVPVRNNRVIDLRVTAYAGDELAFVAGPDLVAWSVSGYLLADP